MAGPNFDREMFPDAAALEGVDEWTHRRGEGVLHTFVNITHAGDTWGSSLMDLLGRRGNGMRYFVLQVRRHAQGSQRSPSEWEWQGQIPLEIKRCDAYYGQTSEQKIVNRDAGR